MNNERLTPAQRNAIIQRDNNTSQMRHYSEKRGFHTGCQVGCPVEAIKRKLQVHHINPFGNGGTNDPENLITLYQCEHVGKKCDGTLVEHGESFVVHPDMVKGFQEYRKGNSNAINEVMERRKPLKEHGEIYWATDHDAEMAETALERTKEAKSRGWKYPYRNKR